MAEKIIELVFGKRGSGKSFLAKKLLQQHDRYIVYDTLGEYTEGVIVQDLEELKALWGKVYRRPFRIIYQPLDPDGEFPIIATYVLRCGNVTLLIEEVDRYARPLAMCQQFKEIVQRGRHNNIALIGVTQRPPGVDRLLTSQAKKMCIFNTSEPRDIEYFKDVIGDTVAAKIEQLKQYEYVEWLDGREELLVKKETL
jgi:hypothetical protein